MVFSRRGSFVCINVALCDLVLDVETIYHDGRMLRKSFLSLVLNKSDAHKTVSHMSQKFSRCYQQLTKFPHHAPGHNLGLIATENEKRLAISETETINTIIYVGGAGQSSQKRS